MSHCYCISHDGKKYRVSFTDVRATTSKKTRKEFREYCDSFYIDADCVYDYFKYTPQEFEAAFDMYLTHYPNLPEFGCDSTDRERVRDLILCLRGKKEDAEYEQIAMKIIARAKQAA